MHNPISLGKSFSSNKYTRKSQLILHIKELRDILQAQKFSNEIYYQFSHLIDSIKYYKRDLKNTESKILDYENTNSRLFS